MLNNAICASTSRHTRNIPNLSMASPSANSPVSKRPTTLVGRGAVTMKTALKLALMVLSMTVVAFFAGAA
jgi:hypothetical protein